MNPMRRFLALALGLAFGAGAFSVKAQTPESEAWKQYPAREAVRPLRLPAGGYQIGLDLSYLSSHRAFDDEGRVVIQNYYTNLLAADLSLRYGLSPRWEVFGGLPFLSGKIDLSKGGAIGDVYFGVRAGLISSPGLDLGAGLKISSPTGDADYHYDIRNGRARLQNFRTGDPNYDYFPELWLRASQDPWAFRVTAQGVFTQQAEVAYNTLGGNNAHLLENPGDGYRATAGIYYQAADPLCLSLDLQYAAISSTNLGGKDLHDEYQLLDLAPALLFQPAPQTDILLSAQLPLSGHNAPAGYPVLLQIRSRF